MYKINVIIAGRKWEGVFFNYDSFLNMLKRLLNDKDVIAVTIEL